MNAVIFGANGQLGRELSRRLPGAPAFRRAEADITDAAALAAVLERHRPEIVFNAVSDNRVDFAEGNPTPAFAVNALGVRSLALACRDVGAKLVHFSTNYVFGRERKRNTPYREAELPAPPNAYGVSKLIGEEFARSISANSLVIRTAALFGRSAGSRHNFLENMLAKALAGQTVRIVDDQTIAPTTTADLASATINLTRAGAAGVFHLNGSGETTWYELARRFFTLAGVANRIAPVTSAEFAAAAPRPTYSVLCNDKYVSMGFSPPMRWDDAVDEYWRQAKRRGE
jgi:dTDP-4-dehydrorhamnose reductase